MVLINGLTIDEINAALIALQRGQGEVVGGVKGTTIQNISISNSSNGSSNPDFTPQINALLEKDEELAEAVQDIKGKQNDMQTELENMGNSLMAHGVKGLFWDSSTNMLSLIMQNNQPLSVEIPSDTVTLTLGDDNVLHFTMGGANDYYPQTIDLTLPYIRSSEKGEANGVATLDNTGRIPYSQLPESAMTFLGEWDASTNTPHLEDGTGTNGDFYVVSAGGTVNFGTQASPRNITFYPNDRVIYEGENDQWFRLPAGEVRTVNGLSGDVTLTANNIDYSTGVTIKQKIDSIEPVQSDWEEDDTNDPAYIKNKIPIWIANGQADDNMTPVDNVTDGQMRPVTSNAVAEAVGDKIVAVYFNEVTTNGLIGITVTPYNLDDYRVCGISVNYYSSNQNATCFSYSFQKYNSSKTWVYVRMGTSTPNDNTRLRGYLLLVKVS